MPFKIIHNDITKVSAEVIVNTANPNPICASGTDLAIYEAAGKEQLLAERAGIGKIARGDIAVTGAYGFLKDKELQIAVSVFSQFLTENEIEIILVSAAEWLYDSIERTRETARATANVTHNHPEGIKGAEATASAIYIHGKERFFKRRNQGIY